MPFEKSSCRSGGGRYVSLRAIRNSGRSALRAVGHRNLVQTSARASAANSNKIKVEPFCWNVLVNMLCHAAICSRGFILHIAACPDINGQFDIAMFPSRPMVIECGMTKIPKNRNAASPKRRSILAVVWKVITTQYSRIFIRGKVQNPSRNTAF